MPEIHLPTAGKQNQIATDIGAVKTTANTINTNTTTANLGAPASAASNALSAVAHAKLNWLLANSGKAVKSVQRGEVLANNANSSYNVVINGVNMTKSIVMSEGDKGVTFSRLKTDINGDLQVGTAVAGTRIYWQVIEFY